MTTPATQSSSALGRRSLPSTFLDSIQNARRYMERRGDTGGSASDDAGDNARENARDNAGHEGGDRSGGGVNDGEGLLHHGLQSGLQAQRASQPAKPMAFAEVARQVWSSELEPDPKQRQPGADPFGAAAATQLLESRGEISSGADAAAGSGAERAGPARDSADHGSAVQGSAMQNRAAQNSAAQNSTVQGPSAGDAYALAHDANNLLSALRLYSELLCFSGVLHERHLHYAEDLKLLSLRSQRLIEQLLLLAEQVGVAQTLSHAAAGIAPGQTHTTGLNVTGAADAARIGIADTALGWEAWSGVPVEGLPEAVDLGDTLRRISGVLGTIARGALEVNLQGTAGLRVAIQEQPLERILVNLVANAAAAVRDGGAVRIRVGAVEGNPGYVALMVDDSGRGMSEGELAAALGTRLDTQRLDAQQLDAQQLGPQLAAAPVPPAAGSKGRKRGLGLAIVRQLVAESGGRFFAYSQAGRGTRIEIRWEREDAHARPTSDPGAQSDLASQSQLDLQAGSEPGSSIRPLPFVSWKNPARPSLAAGPVAGPDAEPTSSLNRQSGGTAPSEIKRRAALSGGTTGAKGAVAC